MKSTLALIAAAAALLCATALFAQSDEDLINPDRPGIADGSQTVKHGTFQVELGAERDHQVQGGADDVTLSTPLLLRYGLTDAFELRVETSGFERDTTTTIFGGDRNTASGLAPISAGFKFHFLDEDQKIHRPSLGVIGRIFAPSGSRDLRSHETTADIRLAADLDLSDRWAINPNIGVASYVDGGRYTAALAALTVQYNFTKKLNAFVDGGFQSPEQKRGKASLLLDTGAAWIIGTNTQLDFSIGWSARGETVPNVFVSAGVSERF
jgi:Putative MetA-pathway of phenol degradation